MKLDCSVEGVKRTLHLRQANVIAEETCCFQANEGGCVTVQLYIHRNLSRLSICYSVLQVSERCVLSDRCQESYERADTGWCIEGGLTNGA